MDPLEFPTVLAQDFPFSLSCSRLPSYGGWRERERERERERDCCQRTEKSEGRESALTKASMIKSVIILIWGRILRERERRPVCVHVIEERNVVGLGGRERERERERLRCQRIEKRKAERVLLPQ